MIDLLVCDYLVAPAPPIRCLAFGMEVHNRPVLALNDFDFVTVRTAAVLAVFEVVVGEWLISGSPVLVGPM